MGVAENGVEAGPLDAGHGEGVHGQVTLHATRGHVHHLWGGGHNMVVM